MAVVRFVALRADGAAGWRQRAKAWSAQCMAQPVAPPDYPAGQVTSIASPDIRRQRLRRCVCRRFEPVYQTAHIP